MGKARSRAANRRRSRRHGEPTSAGGEEESQGPELEGIRDEQLLVHSLALWRRFLWLIASFFCLYLATLSGGAAAAGLGWAGTQGTFTVRHCYEADASRGGTYTRCVGTFRSDEGDFVDREAHLAWDNGSAGRERQVQSAELGGYQSNDKSDALLNSLMSTVLAVGALGCSIPVLSVEAKLRLLSRLPLKAQMWYEREWSPRAG